MSSRACFRCTTLTCWSTCACTGPNRGQALANAGCATRSTKTSTPSATTFGVRTAFYFEWLGFLASRAAMLSARSSSSYPLSTDTREGVVLWWCEHNLVCADIGKPTFPCKVALAPSTSGKSAASRLRRTESASVFSLICSTLLGGPLRLGKGDGGLEAALALDAEAGARVALWGLAAEGLCEPA